MRPRRGFRRVDCLAVLFLAVPLAHGQPQGTMMDLGTLGGGQSWAMGINDRGQVVGGALTALGTRRAFLHERGTMLSLGTLGGNDSVATAINERGQVVGYSTIANGALHAFFWEAGRMRDLGTLGGPNSLAYAINELGQVAGQAETVSGELHAFLWDNGQMLDLGTLGGASSVAYALNNRGQVVGESAIPSGYQRAFLWQNGQMRNLGIDASPTDYSRASGINDLGQIVGIYSGTGQYRFSYFGFLWENGTTIQLTSGQMCSSARAINNAGQIAGHAEICFADGPAVMWDHGGMVYLGSLATGAGYAAAINNRGQIVGSTAAYLRVFDHAFFWRRK